MILVILDSASNLPLCRSYLQKLGDAGKAVTVFLNPESESPVSPGLPLQPAPLLSADEKIHIDELGTRLANTWTLANPVSEKSEYRGLNLGALLGHGLDYFWIHLLKQYWQGKKLIRDVRPDRILVAYAEETSGAFSRPEESYYARCAEALARKFGIPVEALNQPVRVSQEAADLSPRSNIFKEAFLNRLCLTQPRKAKQAKVAVLGSLRVFGSLLANRDANIPWLYLTEKATPKIAARLFRQGIPVLNLGKLKSKQPVHQPEDMPADAERHFEKSFFFEYEGLSLFSLARARLKQVWRLELPVLKAWIDRCYLFFNQYDLEALVVDEDVTVFHKALVEVARQCRVPSVVVQHGVTGQRRGYTPLSASKFACWGEVSKGQMTDWQVPAAALEITGSPFIQRQEKGMRDGFKKKFQLPAGQPVLFYAPSRMQQRAQGTLSIKLTPAEHRELFESILQTVNRLEHGILVVKVHPGDRIDGFQKILDEQTPALKKRVHLFADIPLHALLSVTDVLICSSSTVCIEAMALDIPVVNVNLAGKQVFIPFGAESPVYDIQKREALFPALQRALQQPAELQVRRRRYFERYCGPQDGQAMARIFHLIQGERERGRRIKRMGAIIQARMSSARLPGKVLKPLGDRPALEQLIRRVSAVIDPASIVVATSTAPEDDAIEVLAKKLKVQVFRGSLEGVLERYYQAAQKYSIDPVIRITGDCPLIETAYLQDLIQLYRDSDAQYVTAKDPALFPRGTTAEIFSFAALESAWREGSTPEDRGEFVTWYVRKRPERFKTLALQPRSEWHDPDFRLALDEERDYALLKELFGRLYDANPLFGLNEIFDLYRREPAIFEINKSVQAKS